MLTKELFPLLTIVDVGYNNIDGEGALYLANRLLRQLYTLNMNKNLIADMGAIALAKRLPHSNITTLYLCSNHIGVRGAKALANGLPKGLKQFAISWNKIGVLGAKALINKLPKELRFLHISGNAIGDSGALALAKKKAS